MLLNYLKYSHNLGVLNKPIQGQDFCLSNRAFSLKHSSLYRNVLLSKSPTCSGFLVVVCGAHVHLPEVKSVSDTWK